MNRELALSSERLFIRAPLVNLTFRPRNPWLKRVEWTFFAAVIGYFGLSLLRFAITS
jgi:hypothetical protein